MVVEVEVLGDGVWGCVLGVRRGVEWWCVGLLPSAIRRGCCAVVREGSLVCGCGVVWWCGVMWCGAVRCGAVRCGIVVRCNTVWCGVVGCGLRWDALLCGADTSDGSCSPKRHDTRWSRRRATRKGRAMTKGTACHAMVWR